MKGIPARSAMALLGLALGATTVLANDAQTASAPVDAKQQQAAPASTTGAAETAPKPVTPASEKSGRKKPAPASKSPKPAAAATALASADAAKTQKTAAAAPASSQSGKQTQASAARETAKKQKVAAAASTTGETSKSQKAPAATGAVEAEKAQAAPGPVTSAQAVASAKAVASAPQGFTYNSGGRRDPFVTLIRKGTDAGAATVAARAAGLAGLTSSEVTLRGILASQGAYVAMLHGTDQKTYIVHPGDKLADGTIQTITADAMIIQQRMTEALALQNKQPREIRKVLRRAEGTN